MSTQGTDQPLTNEQVLNGALSADITDVIVIAKKQGGGLYFASAIPDGAVINLLLDLAKKRLLAMIDGGGIKPVPRAPEPLHKPKLVLPN